VAISRLEELARSLGNLSLQEPEEELTRLGLPAYCRWALQGRLSGFC
jgi:hypothetical protein